MFQSASSSGAAGHHLGQKGSFPSAGRAGFFGHVSEGRGRVLGAEDHPEMVYLHDFPFHAEITRFSWSVRDFRSDFPWFSVLLRYLPARWVTSKWFIADFPGCRLGWSDTNICTFQHLACLGVPQAIPLLWMIYDIVHGSMDHFLISGSVFGCLKMGQGPMWEEEFISTLISTMGFWNR